MKNVTVIRAGISALSVVQRSDGSSRNRERIRLGISACLLGEHVRFDAGHKRDPFLVETLGPFVDERDAPEIRTRAVCGPPW